MAREAGLPADNSGNGGTGSCGGQDCPCHVPPAQKIGIKFIILACSSCTKKI